jgi:hypothetical protein
MKRTLRQLTYLRAHVSQAPLHRTGAVRDNQTLLVGTGCGSLPLSSRHADLAEATARHGIVCTMAKSSAQQAESPSQLIDDRIKELGDWRGKTLFRLRDLIKQADPEVVEEWKWRKPSNPGVPVWSHQGGICTGETYKSVVKLTFFKGASLKDPSRLFNSSLEGNVRRAIDFHEDDEIDEKAFITLIRAAVSLNESSAR